MILRPKNKEKKKPKKQDTTIALVNTNKNSWMGKKKRRKKRKRKKEKKEGTRLPAPPIRPLQVLLAGNFQFNGKRSPEEQRWPGQ